MKKQRILRACALAGAMALALGAPAVAEPAATEEPVDMLEVDHKLYELGYRDGACNGVLDAVTINALCNFQLANGLEVTGQADADTVARLFGEEAVGAADYLAGVALEYAEMPALANGSYGESVSRLQQALKALGYFEGSSDGAYGEATEAAVSRFQLANGLKETGIADSAVFLRIYAGTPVSWTDFLQDSCASVGDSGSNVRMLQVWLTRKGYFRGECTGRYGEETQRAVKRFQSEAGLESSGDVDMNTIRALFSDMNALMMDSSAIRRGETGAESEALCRDLAALGYPAHARFNMQSELALMEFQLVNGLPVTGVADAATQARLRAESAVSLDEYVPGALEMPEEETFPARLARLALSLLGQMSELETDFGFVQYVYLKCGVGLMDASQLSATEVGAADALSAGSVLGVTAGGREIFGIVSSDRALIYRADSGYIVMRYLEEMSPDAVRLYRPAEEA